MVLHRKCHILIPEKERDEEDMIAEKDNADIFNNKKPYKLFE